MWRRVRCSDNCFCTKATPQPAAADRNRIGVRSVQFDQAIVAGPLQPHHALDIDDVAAVHPQEPAGVEPGLYVADRQRAEQLRGPVENICVMGIGVHRDHAVDGALRARGTDKSVFKTTFKGYAATAANGLALRDQQDAVALEAVDL